MKKVLFLSTFFALSFFSAQAQFNPNASSGNEESSFSIGIKSGVNFSKFGVEYSGSKEFFNVSNRLGFNFGVVADIPFGGSRFGIQPELSFSQRGATSEQDVDVPGVLEKMKVKDDLNYLDIPILFKYKFGGEDRGIALMLGPSFNFLLNAKSNFSGILETETVALTTKPEIGSGSDDAFKGLDVSLGMGLNAYFKVGNGKFFIDARYMLGLTNILNDGLDVDDFSDKNLYFMPILANEMKNRSLQLSVGYFFPIGGNKVW